MELSIIMIAHFYVPFLLLLRRILISNFKVVVAPKYEQAVEFKEEEASLVENKPSEPEFMLGM